MDADKNLDPNVFGPLKRNLQEKLVDLYRNGTKKNMLGGRDEDDHKMIKNLEEQISWRLDGLQKSLGQDF